MSEAEVTAFFAACEAGTFRDDDQPAWLVELARASTAEVAFDLTAAKTHLARARSAVPPGAFQRVLALLDARVAVREARPAQLVTTVDDLQRLLAELADDERATRARSLHLLAVACLRLDRLDQAEVAIEHALAFAERGPALLWMMDTLAQVLIAQGAWNEAIHTLDALVERRAAASDHVGLAISAGHLSRLHLQLGRAFACAATASKALAGLPDGAAILTRMRLQTLLVEASLDLESPDLATSEQELARLVTLAGDIGHYLCGYALVVLSRCRTAAGDGETARSYLERAAHHSLPESALLLSEAMVDATATKSAAWTARFEAVVEKPNVTELEIRTHLWLVRRATDVIDKRAHLDRAYRRAMLANNPLWMRWVDDVAVREDPLLHAEKVAERFAGRTRRELAATTREEVTMIFADLVDFTPRALVLPPEDVIATVRALFELGAPLLARHRVTPISYMGDGLLAICQGDGHAARGFAFARDLVARAGRASRMRRLLDLGWPLDLRAGVATGTVVLGTLGTLFKTDFAAIGITTNLAARLQSLAAPGEVVCAVETARAAALDAPVEYVKLKGFERRDSIGVCRLVVYTPGQ